MLLIHQHSFNQGDYKSINARTVLSVHTLMKYLNITGMIKLVNLSMSSEYSSYHHGGFTILSSLHSQHIHQELSQLHAPATKNSGILNL